MLYQAQPTNILSIIEKFDAMNTKETLQDKAFVYLLGSHDYSAFDLEDSDDSDRGDDQGKYVMDGTVIRTGDIVKLGRVTLFVKEWSLDTKRHSE